MNSLEWRTKKLEDKILGPTADLVHVDRFLGQTDDHVSIYEKLDSMTKQYQAFLDTSGKNYTVFLELYNKYKNSLNELDDSTNINEASKAELVLAYEDDLKKYMNDTQDMISKADSVLDIKNWPDLGSFRERLNKLQEITKDHYVQSLAIDDRTEELIEIYNNIIGSFKNNMLIWNQRLEAYENYDEKKQDSD